MATNSRHRPLTYEVIGTDIVAKCCKCDETLTLNVTPDQSRNPHFVVQKITQRGWEYDSVNRRRCRCPAHVSRAKATTENKALAEALEEAAKEALAPKPKVTETVRASAPPPAETPIVTVPPETPLKEPPVPADNVTTLHPPATTAVRDVSPAKKSRIREMLDTYYDPDRGCYSSAKTDQLIALELDVPWAVVEQMREAAYGPILIDPEVDDLRNSYKGLLAKVEEAEKHVEQAMLSLDKSTKDAKALLARIEALDSRRKRK